MLDNVTAPLGAEFSVWTRDSQIHWDTSVNLIGEFDPANPEHVRYNAQNFHSADDMSAAAKHLDVKTKIELGQEL